MSLNLSERAKKSLRSEWMNKQAKLVKARAEVEVLEATIKGITDILGDMSPKPEGEE